MIAEGTARRALFCCPFVWPLPSSHSAFPPLHAGSSLLPLPEWYNKKSGGRTRRTIVLAKGIYLEFRRLGATLVEHRSGVRSRILGRSEDVFERGPKTAAFSLLLLLLLGHDLKRSGLPGSGLRRDHLLWGRSYPWSSSSCRILLAVTGGGGLLSIGLGLRLAILLRLPLCGNLLAVTRLGRGLGILHCLLLRVDRRPGLIAALSSSGGFRGVSHQVVVLLLGVFQALVRFGHSLLMIFLLQRLLLLFLLSHSRLGHFKRLRCLLQLLGSSLLLGRKLGGSLPCHCSLVRLLLSLLHHGISAQTALLLILGALLIGPLLLGRLLLLIPLLLRVALLLLILLIGLLLLLIRLQLLLVGLLLIQALLLLEICCLLLGLSFGLRFGLLLAQAPLARCGLGLSLDRRLISLLIPLCLICLRGVLIGLHWLSLLSRLGLLSALVGIVIRRIVIHARCLGRSGLAVWRRRIVTRYRATPIIACH